MISKPKILFVIAVLLWPMFVRPQASAPPASARVTMASGGVQLRTQKADWTAAAKDQSLFEQDRLRTLEDGRAIVELHDRSQLRLNPRSELVITPARSGSGKSRIEILRGLSYFLHRNQPKEIDIETPAGAAAIEGTEFVIEVQQTGTTILSLVDGRVELSNELGKVSLASGEQGIIERHKAPRKTAVIAAQNAVQWCLYYPGVLDLNDLGLDSDASEALAASLSAYREGDLLRALALYPTNRVPETAPERLYIAALKLSSGGVTNYDELMLQRDAANPSAHALGLMIAALQQKPIAVQRCTNASEWLALSYYFQSLDDLSSALESARVSAEISPDFGFAWERVAELEFSFGRTAKAEDALNRALALTPRNAQAHALHGFLLLARHQSEQAQAEFEAAMKIDPMLSNAKLGSGLQKIYEGHAVEGRAELQAAAILEPNRWLLRSYLGKSYAHEALFNPDRQSRRELRSLAEKELELAKAHDPLDPTPWLYSALLRHDEYRTAEAIHDLEQSQRLNDNRQVYRSRLLLDQDQAVRSANLANIFEDAGMNEVGLRESARAVSFDYGNYSAHLNLASSFNALRDPTRFNLRYESEWFNEHLLATLLAPVGAGSLSQNLSQQEYSRLFGTKQFGLSGTTEYFSNHELRQTASQFGTIDNTSYALDLEYNYKDGIRTNNDLSRIEWYSRVKQQITPEDSLLLLTKYQDYDSGDNFQYYDPAASSRPHFRYKETQTPGLLLGGWHHEWSPGAHTIALGGRLQNDQVFSDLAALQRLEVVNPVGVLDPTTVPFDVRLHTEFEIYTAELNQIFQRPHHTDIVGVRYQDGSVNAESLLNNPPPAVAPAFSLPIVSTTRADFRRASGYAYHHWEIVDGLMLIGGVAYDDIRYPANFRRPPVSGAEKETQRWSPKAGLIWQMTPRVTIRGIYSHATGGMSYDESIRLEPTQIAGFGQSFRSIISESLAGSVEAPDYRIAGGALDAKLWTDSWLTLQGELLSSKVDREIGLFSYDFGNTPPASPASTIERLDYHEQNVGAIFNQILGREWFLQAQYQFSRSELKDELPLIAATKSYRRSIVTRADLHEIKLAATWRPPSGIFTRGEVAWYEQALSGSSPQPAGDSFPQLNLYAGYRFPRRSAELTFGVLNVTEQNYHLSPLNYYIDLPRERLFYTRIRFNF